MNNGLVVTYYVPDNFQEDKEKLLEIYGDKLWYNGVENVKTSKIDISCIIDDRKLSELRKCSQDPLYWIENYVYIDNKDYGIILFKLRGFQKKIIKAFEENRFVLVKVGRQLGKTILVCAYFLWNLLFKHNFTIEMFANEDALAKENLERIKFMYEHLPIWMQEGVKKYNEGEIVFENGSKIKSRVATGKGGRGGTNNIVYGDEIGTIEDSIMQQWLRTSFPTITSSKKTKFFGTSTPKGLNTFWHLFTEGLIGREEEGKPGKNGIVSLSFPWDVDGIRDENFKKEIIEKFGIKYWEQEYECKFIGTSDTLLSSEILERLVGKEPLRIQKLFDKYDLRIYQEPIQGHNYIMTHDASEGLGDEHDATAIKVWDCSYPKKIIEVAVLVDNRIDDTEAPKILKKIGKMYYNALEISENNEFPHIPKNLMIEEDYENVYINPADGRYGVKMTPLQRKIALARMKKEFMLNRVEIYDYQSIKELNVFSRIKNKYQALPGYHDDTVMSSALLFWLMADPERYDEYFRSKFFVEENSKSNKKDKEEGSYFDIELDDGNSVTKMLDDSDDDSDDEEELDYIDKEINKNGEDVDDEDDFI